MGPTIIVASIGFIGGFLVGLTYCLVRAYLIIEKDVRKEFEAYKDIGDE